MRVFPGKVKKLKSSSKFNFKSIVIWSAAFAAIGVITLVASRAATPGISVTVDSSLPNPINVKAYGDDQVATIQWEAPADAKAKGIVGYYVTWGAGGVYTNAKQTTYTITQIQPLKNGTTYNIKVQSVQGSKVAVSTPGGYYETGAEEARANGKVSPGVPATVTASPARVDMLRTKMTGFFDDFNTPSGAMDELKWNTATSACAKIGTAGAFLNNQFHAHNQVRSECDRSQIVSRPRATFDITGKTEADPGMVAMDFDGITHGRDIWYLDLIPLTVRKNNVPLDITSHADIFDGNDSDPMTIRFTQASGNTSIRAYGANKKPVAIELTYRCPDSETLGANFQYCSSNPDRKAAFSPLPEPEVLQRIDRISQPYYPAANVRQHWRWEISPTKLKVFLNDYQIIEGKMPADFVNIKQYTVHSNVFSYNTGKDDHTNPTTSMLHWDNFGFNGPSPATVVHNYMEGGPDGKTPYLGRGTVAKPLDTDTRLTKFSIPDPINRPKQARLMFTLGNFGPDNYHWSQDDHVLINGKRYNFADPTTTVQPPALQTYYGPLIAEGYVPHASSIIIPDADVSTVLKQGINDVMLNIGQEVRYNGIYNVHLELEYTKGTEPSYTPPTAVFGNSTLLAAVQPAMSSHDSYMFIEQDMGLPSGVIDGSTPVTPPPTTPPSDTTKPVVKLTAPTANTSVVSGAKVTASADASDAGGSIKQVDFSIGGSFKGSDTTAPYSIEIDTAGVSAGAYSIIATATDGAGNVQSSSPVAISVTVPATTTTPGRFNTLPVNASLPTDSDCSARVHKVPEVRASINAGYNARKGVGGNYTYPRVTGNYAGTTDEIIQWTACKWGMDEDLLRAQAVKESYWFQNSGGDFTNEASRCTPVYPIGSYPGGSPGQCPESIGILQVRWSYHQSAFFQDASNTILTNNAVYSTAYNLDYYGAVWRSCFNGELTWLNTVDRGRDYGAGDAQGCQGMWFSGRWHTGPAETYIADVQNILTTRVWEQSYFLNATSTAPIKSPPATNPSTTPPVTPPVTPPADTTAPAATVTSPASGSIKSGTLSLTANATDNVAVVSVSFYLDGSSTPVSTDTTAPYAGSWNSATVANGTHKIVAKATDSSGVVGTSPEVTFTVTNVVPDTTKPTTSIVTPVNGVTASGNAYKVTVNAADNVGVARVELLIDGVIRATDLTAPYSFDWDTTAFTNGSHTLTVHAFDAANLQGTSATVSVTVNNVVALPATPKAGDVNGDSVINGRDLSVLLKSWGQSVSKGTGGDLDNNGVVNGRDLSLLLKNWGK